MNLLNFPTPYPDEELRSLIYRYTLRKSCSFSEGIQDLLEINSRRIPFLPHNLAVMQNKLPPSLFVNGSLIANHTFFPLFATFLSEENRNELLARMTNYRQAKVNATLMVPPIISKNVRYCVRCAHEEYNRYGEVYIHRSHQVGHIDVCHIHGDPLINKCPLCEVPLGLLYGTKFIGSAVCPNGHELLPVTGAIDSDDMNQLKLLISKDIHLLLNGGLSVSNIFDFYSLLAKDKEYQHRDGRYINQKFLEDFFKHYSHSTLNHLGITPELLQKRTALLIFSKKNATRNPIVHLLVLHWLLGGCQRINNYVETVRLAPQSFGKEPWPCMNKICKAYSQKVIYSNEEHYCRKSNRVVGKFTCAHCQMKYQASCSDSDRGFDVDTVKVIEYGKLWHDRLIKEYRMKKSINEIASVVGANRSTVKKYILRNLESRAQQSIELVKGSVEWVIKLYQTYDQLRSIYETSILLHTSKGVVSKYIKNRELYEREIIPAMNEAAATTEVEVEPKMRLIKLLEENPDLSRSDIRKTMGSKVVSQLMKEDGEWLNSILPRADHPFKSPKWDDEDKKLLLVVNRMCQELYENPPNKQIKRYTILNKLSIRDKARLINHSDKLPRTIEIIEQYLEPTEEYQLRQIPHTVALYRKHYGNVTLPMILKNSIYDNCSQKVKGCIQEYLQSLIT
ncbi:hypothetical protein D3C76_135090 [compost metagenome]